MSIITFSKCRIQFIPNDRQRPERNYSDRTLIELRQYDFLDFSLRAVDVDNNNAEIFNVPFKKPDQYKRGQTANEPDEIHTKAGTYKLWLNDDTHQIFHETIDTCSEVLTPGRPSGFHSNESDQDTDDGNNNDSNDISDDDIHSKSDTPDQPVAYPKELLLKISRLSKCIEIGAGIAAAQLSSELASQNIRLQAKSLRTIEDEKEFTIYVQLDGNEYGIDQHGGKIPVDVFRLTTVRELRAIFESAYQYPPSNQYFFVNGYLAHDNLTMKDLNVGPNSLFVLFVLTHPKIFRNTASGPWECLICKKNNDQHHFRCVTCAAARTD
ncbi:unnamed protein product [Rotaria sp. Silwood1]|nr:unnamed protein product [Rotaria sp. Silwood1]